MQTDCEPVVAALFAHLQKTVAGIKYASRRMKLWSECPNQPVLFLRHIGETVEWPDRRLSKTTLHLEIWLYLQAGKNPETASDVGLNALIQSVLDAFAPDDPMIGAFTLGGLLGMGGCARVEGKIDRYPGDLDKQAIAVIPVNVLLP